MELLASEAGSMWISQFPSDEQKLDKVLKSDDFSRVIHGYSSLGKFGGKRCFVLC